MSKLRNHDGTGEISIRKEDLERDGRVAENGDIIETTGVTVDRIGRDAYVVRIPDETGDLPELAECPEIRRIASEIAVDLVGATGHSVPSD
jgi:hypothetical protein